MNNKFQATAIAILLLFFISCKKEQEAKEGIYPDLSPAEQNNSASPAVDNDAALIAQGKKLFEGKGTCTACHQIDKKVIGPSVKEIAKIYREKELSIAEFLNGNSEAVVDPPNFSMMEANFVITKRMTKQERKALELYMLSF